MESLISIEGRFILYVFLMDYHSGQWSRGYRILSKLKVSKIGDHYIKECRESVLYSYLVYNYASKV